MSILNGVAPESVNHAAELLSAHTNEPGYLSNALAELDRIEFRTKTARGVCETYLKHAALLLTGKIPKEGD